VTDQQSVEIHVQVSMLEAVNKRPPEATFRYPSPAPAAYGDRREFDPSYVAIQLLFQQEGYLDFVLNMLISTEMAKKLNLMAGDKLKLSITKEGS
jgi:hypothetical protein